MAELDKLLHAFLIDGVIFVTAVQTTGIVPLFMHLNHIHTVFGVGLQ